MGLRQNHALHHTGQGLHGSDTADPHCSHGDRGGSVDSALCSRDARRGVELGGERDDEQGHGTFSAKSANEKELSELERKRSYLLEARKIFRGQNIGNSSDPEQRRELEMHLARTTPFEADQQGARDIPDLRAQ
eukprot:4040984-Pyramimonas_sp.AAC.1